MGKKLNDCEQELKSARNELAESQRATADSEAKAEAERTKNSFLEKEIEKLEDLEKEKIVILNHNLSEAKNVAETQKNELKYLKSELEKSKEIIQKLKNETLLDNEENIDFFSEMTRTESLNRNSSTEESAQFEPFLNNKNTIKRRMADLEQKLEKKSIAYNDLKRENLRLKDSVERKKRNSLKKGTEHGLTRSMSDLS